MFDNFQAVDLGTSVQYSPPAGIDSAWNATQVSEAIILGLFSAAKVKPGFYFADVTKNVSSKNLLY